jgi:hypothetical protein
MNRKGIPGSLFVGFGFLLFTLASAHGLVLGLMDGNSAVSIDVDSQHGLFNWIVDGVNLAPTVSGGATDHRQWFWYRLSSNPEASIDTLTRGSTGVSDVNLDGNPDTAFVSYSGAPGFKINVTFALTGGSTGSGTSHIHEQVSIVNTSQQTVTLSLFKYGDFQLSATSGGMETVSFVNSNAVQETGSPGFALEAVHTPVATHREAEPFPITISKLTNSVPDNLADNSGAGPDVITWAYQWDITVTPGQTVLIVADIQAAVPKPSVTILSIVRETNNIRLAWATTAGRTNVVQATAGSAGSSYTNNFADISGPIVVPGSGQVSTNYLDTGGATNRPARYYRVRLVP